MFQGNLELRCYNYYRRRKFENAAIEFSGDIASIDTANADRDGHLRSAASSMLRTSKIDF